ncbi:indolepyruvate ferredoxin oxidoreductase [uncultured Gammaproteobacteria bacterium]
MPLVGFQGVKPLVAEGERTEDVMSYPMDLTTASLDDKYTLDSGRVYLTGTQALVRLPMMQRRRDLAAGLNTAGFISGYRGSPLGGVDQELWRVRPFLEKHHLHFQPGINEELAATAVWGSQQVNLFPGARYDGVFGLWYGKGPGVDRSGDAFRHANFAGSSRHGGVLVLAGDDHAAKSSTVPHQSEHAFVHSLIPVLNPAGLAEVLEYGLLGWALSRWSGCWVALKTISETVDSSGSVAISSAMGDHVLPADFDLPAGGLNIRWPDPSLEQEERLLRHKLRAALAFVRANRLDRVMIAAPRPRLGVVTTGKSYLDVRQALDDLGISEAMAADFGLSVYKVAMSWPLERDGIRHFAEGLEEIVVVEEKRGLIEHQLKEQLYNWQADVRPRVVGKFDEHGAWLLPSAGELSPARIAVELGRRLLKIHNFDWLAERVAFLDQHERDRGHPSRVLRRPHFCSGCPHNTSTVVPTGSRALAGIGCHYMVHWMDRRTETFTQMGGEGASWIGQAPFTETPHVFTNLGDGTYVHSGVMAIRAAVAAKVNMTYKLLFNDAVAMTGGQPMDGGLTVARLTRQLAAEGVVRIVVMSDQPEKYGRGTAFAPGTIIEHRDQLDRVQRGLREVPGVTALVYDQTCAAELRRRRKRGTQEEPSRRVVINELVCEGCGDCSKKSNCLSVVPVETEFGRKRRIDQSSCNKDFSCLNGFCPSFVTVEGGRLKPSVAVAGGQSADDIARGLPEPVLPALGNHPYGVTVTGVGGTGVVTIAALLGMAAHLEGKGCSVLDMAGLAQKGGAVTSHIRLAATPDQIHAVRIAAGGAAVVIGCDAVVAGSGDALSKMAPGRTRAVINSHETIVADFIRDPLSRLPMAGLLDDIRAACGEDQFPGAVCVIDATALAGALLGDAVAANPFLLGYAWQKGLLPVSRAALERAIELNHTAVALNLAAFAWGRRAADDSEAVTLLAAAAEDPAGKPDHHRLSPSLDEVIERRAATLVQYQDRFLAERYRGVVAEVRAAERRAVPGKEALTEAVARNYFKLLAIKDEYEVARLLSDPAFHRDLAVRFEPGFRVRFYLAPPLLARADQPGAEPRKISFGAWILPVFRGVACLKGLRNTWLDPFARTPDRRLDRALLAAYEVALRRLLPTLSVANHGQVLEIAESPDAVRGFGAVRVPAARAALERLSAQNATPFQGIESRG